MNNQDKGPYRAPHVYTEPAEIVAKFGWFRRTLIWLMNYYELCFVVILLSFLFAIVLSIYKKQTDSEIAIKHAKEVCTDLHAIDLGECAECMHYSSVKDDERCSKASRYSFTQ